jgi:hypothetical protein
MQVSSVVSALIWFLASVVWIGVGLGPEDDIATVYDNALPSFVIRPLIDESVRVHHWSSKQMQYVHEKRSTFWIPVPATRKQRRPRSYIELAIHMLRRYIDNNNTILADMGISAKNIKGAEWWVQKVGAEEDIGFHYDKDEAVASLENRMEFPVLSTVTYLQDCGGPTVIFNMTTDLKGNLNSPEIPEDGLVIFPKKNRHLLFR